MNLFSILRSRRIELFLVAATCTLAGFALGAATNRPMVVTAFQNAKFAPIDPSREDGPQRAVLWGDATSGPSAALLKYPKGPGRMHVHTADYHLVVLQGTMKHWAKGEQEANVEPLHPGSYWFQPGNQAHADACLSDECVMFIKWSGKEDATLAE